MYKLNIVQTNIPDKTAPFAHINNYNKIAPFINLTNDYDFAEQVLFKVDETLSLLRLLYNSYLITLSEVVAQKETQLLYMRQTYPLTYVSYAKSCTTANSFIFGDNYAEFVDAQISAIYNDILNDVQLTEYAKFIYGQLGQEVNRFLGEINNNITFINNWGEHNVALLVVVEDYVNQNYSDIINNKIAELVGLL